MVPAKPIINCCCSPTFYVWWHWLNFKMKQPFISLLYLYITFLVIWNPPVVIEAVMCLKKLCTGNHTIQRSFLLIHIEMIQTFCYYCIFNSIISSSLAISPCMFVPVDTEYPSICNILCLDCWLNHHHYIYFNVKVFYISCEVNPESNINYLYWVTFTTMDKL